MYYGGCGDIKSKVTLCELFGAHIHSSTDFFKSALKCSQKRRLFLFNLCAVNYRLTGHIGKKVLFIRNLYL